MSTNTSQNLGLHLWEPTDQVLRTEFNQNWQKIDTAVAEVQSVADAAYCPSNKPFVCGIYTGNGGTQTVSLGFRPSFVVVNGAAGRYESQSAPLRYLGFFADGRTYENVSVTDTGFTVTREAYTYPELNENLKKYAYIAFR